MVTWCKLWNALTLSKFCSHDACQNWFIRKAPKVELSHHHLKERKEKYSCIVDHGTSSRRDQFWQPRMQMKLGIAWIFISFCICCMFALVLTSKPPFMTYLCCLSSRNILSFVWFCLFSQWFWVGFLFLLFPKLHVQHSSAIPIQLLSCNMIVNTNAFLHSECILTIICQMLFLSGLDIL